jgi:hypothetical protein
LESGQELREPHRDATRCVRSRVDVEVAQRESEGQDQRGGVHEGEGRPSGRRELGRPRGP